MGKMRILVADGHEVVRKGIRTLLESRPKLGICGEASTSGDALAKTKRLKPDLVLLDIEIDNLNGLQTIQAVLKARPHTKVLVLTMHDSGEFACRALAAGASAFVLKSDGARILVRALEAIRGDEIFLSPTVTKIVVNELKKILEIAPSRDVLTLRETEVLKLLAEGRSNKETGAALGISSRTVDSHRASIMHKLNLRTLSDLVHFAIRNKIIDI
jgi:DNA-binding NarL/FixJ family response regulator